MLSTTLPAAAIVNVPVTAGMVRSKRRWIGPALTAKAIVKDANNEI
jgi:hypothetical protein